MVKISAGSGAKEASKSRWKNGLRFGLAGLLSLGVGGVSVAGSPENEQPVAPPHSFLDPVGGFVRDEVWKPVAPFELVPGKDPNGWSFVLEPYAWAMGLSGEIGVKGLPVATLNLSSRTILQNLDWGIFARGELRKGRWGLLADGYYAALSSSGSAENKIYQSANLGVQQSIISLALAYRVIDDRRGYLDVYAGARYNFIGAQLGASLNDSRVDEIGNSTGDAMSARIDARIDAAIKSVLSATEQTVENSVSKQVGSQSLQKMVLQNRDLRSLVRDGVIKRSAVGGDIGGALKNYIKASAEAKIAAAKGVEDPRLASAASAARKNLKQAISGRIEEVTPTYGAGNQWWFDPIIGLRGQVNITRWLFLAAQGDVGGFEAGSQIAWNAQATIGVNFTRNIFAEVGYRYLYVDYAKGDFVYDMNSYGLFTGLGVKF